MISRLSPADKGRWVKHVPANGRRPMRGRIKSFDRSYIYVVFHCNGSWDEYEKGQWIPCKPRDISFIEVPTKK